MNCKPHKGVGSNEVKPEPLFPEIHGTPFWPRPNSFDISNGPLSRQALEEIEGNNVSTRACECRDEMSLCGDALVDVSEVLNSWTALG
jgi:hypothetical protein